MERIPMTIGEKVQTDIVVAMKAKEEHKLTTLRMVKSALRNKEIDKRAPLTEAEETQILTTLIKQRKDSAEQFTKGNRPELAEKERGEIAIIERFLPKQLSEAELEAAVAAVIAEIGAQGMKDMGRIMAALKERHAGQMDGAKASQIVKRSLG